MSLRSFLSDIRQGLKHPAYLLYAKDQFLPKEALFSVKRTIPEAELDFRFNLFDAESLDRPIEQVIDVLYSIPFFGSGGRQVVAIENCQKLKEKELAALAGYIKKPSPDSVLLLLSGVDDKGRLKKTLKEALSSARQVPLDIREAELPSWMKEKAASLGLSLTNSAADYLIGIIGTDCGLLSPEIEKLAQAGLKHLDKKEIEELVKGSGGYDVFDLTKALIGKDKDRVFKIYGALRDSVAPELLLGAINWKYASKTPPLNARELDKLAEILHRADVAIKSTANYPLELTLAELLSL